MKPHATARPIVLAALAAMLAPLCWHLLGVPGDADAALWLLGRRGWHPAASRLAFGWIVLAGLYAWFALSRFAPSAFASVGSSDRAAGGEGHGPRDALGPALAVAAAGVAVLAVGGPPIAALATCAVGLAVLRVSTGRTAANARGALIEASVLLGSLWLSDWLARAFGAGPLAFAASAWGFFLVQGLGFARAPDSRPRGRGGDAFDAARRRLESLLADDRG